jgi:hypothetical protein
MDGYVSQHLSKLTSCKISAIAHEYPESEHWLEQFQLRKMFQNHVRDELFPLAFVIMRRADAALDEWELACSAAKNGLQTPRVYFKVLRHVEQTIAALWQGLEFLRKALGKKLFERGDGSTFERLNGIYNLARHFDPMDLPPGDLHKIWLSNDGIHTNEYQLTFDEFLDTFRELLKFADALGGSPPPTGTSS